MARKTSKKKTGSSASPVRKAGKILKKVEKYTGKNYQGEKKDNSSKVAKPKKAFKRMDLSDATSFFSTLSKKSSMKPAVKKEVAQEEEVTGFETYKTE